MCSIFFQFGCSTKIEDKTFVDLNSKPYDKGEFSWAFKAFDKSKLYFCRMQKFLWDDSWSRKNLNSILAGLLEGKLVTFLANCTKFSGRKFLHWLLLKKESNPDGRGFVLVTGGKLSIDISV